MGLSGLGFLKENNFPSLLEATARGFLFRNK